MRIISVVELLIMLSLPFLLTVHNSHRSYSATSRGVTAGRGGGGGVKGEINPQEFSKKLFSTKSFKILLKFEKKQV